MAPQGQGTIAVATTHAVTGDVRALIGVEDPEDRCEDGHRRASGSGSGSGCA